MVKVKAPKEDPSAKAAREREQARADSAYVDNAQGILDEETRRRVRRLGRRASLAGVSPGGGAGGGSFVPIGSGLAGGGGSGAGGGFCPAPWTKITMEDGSLLAAGALVIGLKVRTQHEHTLERGVFEVTALTRHVDDRMRVAFEDGRELHVTAGHRVYVTGAGWTNADALLPGDEVAGDRPGVVAGVEAAGRGDVIRITIGDAHTYMTEGLLSHNAKPVPGRGDA